MAATVPGDGAPGAPPPPAAGGETDWNARAAEVQANFAATGAWFPGVAPPPGSVDWDAVAAEVTASFAETGQWFL